MSPDSDTIVSPMPGRSSVDSRPRRLAPMSTWVALRARAKSRIAAAASSPTTVWKLPPSSCAVVRSSSSRSGPVWRRPSPRDTYSAVQGAPPSPDGPDPRDAIRARGAASAAPTPDRP
ncbi:MAG: hypothetical protein PGN15_07105 [Aeromicrobium erythreum]